MPWGGKIAGITATIRGSRRGNARGRRVVKRTVLWIAYQEVYAEFLQIELFLYDTLIPFLPYFYNSFYAAGQNHAVA